MIESLGQKTNLNYEIELVSHMYVYLFLLGSWLKFKTNITTKTQYQYIWNLHKLLFSKKTSSCIYKILDSFLEMWFWYGFHCFQMTAI